MAGCAGGCSASVRNHPEPRNNYLARIGVFGRQGDSCTGPRFCSKVPFRYLPIPASRGPEVKPCIRLWELRIVMRKQKAKLRGVDWAFAAEQLDSGMMYPYRKRLSFRLVWLSVATTKSCAHGEDSMEAVAVVLSE